MSVSVTVLSDLKLNRQRCVTSTEAFGYGPTCAAFVQLSRRTQMSTEFISTQHFLLAARAHYELSVQCVLLSDDINTAARLIAEGTDCCIVQRSRRLQDAWFSSLVRCGNMRYQIEQQYPALLTALWRCGNVAPCLDWHEECYACVVHQHHTLVLSLLADIV